MPNSNAKPVKLQARELVRLAKRRKVKLKRMVVHYDNERCLGALILDVLGLDMKDFGYYRSGHKKHPAFTTNQFRGLEYGFEGWNDENAEFLEKRYYRVGQKVAKLVGYA